ncbi:MAG TPA: hypothetical protein VGK99_21000 [Acidobacteriota bacterium]|jgi:hypothetical protein
MKCQDAEKEILSRVGEPVPSLELKAHLQQCARCADLMVNCVEIDSIFHSASVIEPSPFLWTRIESRLEDQSARKGWLSWLPAPASIALAFLLLFSAFLARFEPAIDVDTMLANRGYTPKIADSNPFLMAQAGVNQTRVNNESNPFLDAMLPSAENPFSNPRVR